jgi:superfamily II DNA or RNA helicase
MQILPGNLSVGSTVRVRRGRWRVLEVRPFERCQIVTLEGLSPPYGRAIRRVIAPFDRIEPIGAGKRRLRIVPARMWRRACRAALAADWPAGCLRTAARAHIDLLPHQLEPAMAVVQGRAIRVLLADEVGLGKTIQAGLIVAELMARRAVNRVLILTPAGLRDQWRDELGGRFAIEATVVDASVVARLAASLPPDINPWATIPVAIASIELVKRPEILAAASMARWDLVIVDEAHGVATAPDRYAAADGLCGRASYGVTITATPHNGDTRAYESLCRLGSTGDPLLIFRRTRPEIGLASRRKIHVLTVHRSDDERRMDKALAAFSTAIRNERADAWLALAVLHKRGLSSAWSLAVSVERRLESIGSDDTHRPSQIELPIADREGDFDPGDQPPSWPADLSLSDSALERRLLTQLAAAANRASARESKIEAVRRLLRRSRERVIVFTEYRDTLERVRSVIGARAVVLHGGMSRVERTTALESFAKSSLAVLIATDAAGEGLNLQHGCRLVVNLELPWNPMRLEQRIGRVDRLGQRRTVHAWHLVARATGEVAILDRLKGRLAAADAAVGAPDPLGSHSEERVVARLVITGEHPATTSAPSFNASSSDDRNPAAENEARRILELRRLGVCSVEEDCGTIPVLIAHRSATRQVIGPGILFLWRVIALSGGGAVVDSRLVPIRVVRRHVRSVRWTRTALELLLHELTPALHSHVLDATAEWRNESASIDTAFRSIRLARERALAARLSQRRQAPYQSGLFDRRTERKHAAQAALESSDAADATERMFRSGQPIVDWSIELALVAIGH